MAPKGDANRLALRHIHRVLMRFNDLAGGGEMPLQRMLILTYVAETAETTQVELAKGLQMTTAAVSRNVAALSTLPGALGLLTWVDHPSDRRAKLVTLTVLGQSFMDSIATI